MVGAGAGSVPGGRYDSGQSYGAVSYAVGDPLPPLDDGGVVKLGIANMSHNDLVAFLNNHIACMTGNAFYPTPLPAAADFLAAVTAYTNAVTAAIAAETALRDANTVRNSQQAIIKRMMKGRAGYVQEASNGNRAAIVSSGLGLVSPKTPVTFLPAPWNLRVDLNGEAGLMKIRWNKVTYALTYDLQCSVNTMPRVWETLQSSSQTLALKTMEVGVAYVFRVCAVGSPGRSNWSPEVIRGAA